MTTSEYFILFTVAALLLLVRILDRRFQGRMNADEAEMLGRFGQISKRLAKGQPRADLRLKMGIRQQCVAPQDNSGALEARVPA